MSGLETPQSYEPYLVFSKNVNNFCAKSMLQAVFAMT